MNEPGPHPWELSFSFGRALQSPALKAWSLNPDIIEPAQEAFHRRAFLNGLARRGEYRPELETAIVGVA